MDVEGDVGMPDVEAVARGGDRGLGQEQPPDVPAAREQVAVPQALPRRVLRAEAPRTLVVDLDEVVERVPARHRAGGRTVTGAAQGALAWAWGVGVKGIFAIWSANAGDPGWRAPARLRGATPRARWLHHVPRALAVP